MNHLISLFPQRSVVEEIFRAGRQLGKRGSCPLMYEWHGKRYWGAAHGLAGIMNVLMHMELEPDEIEDVKGTLSYMIQNRFPSGNYQSSERNESDQLVHWCHGAPGVALTLVKAAQVIILFIEILVLVKTTMQNSFLDIVRFLRQMSL